MVRDIRVLCRWPEWQEFRRQLFANSKIDEAKLQEIELTTEVDSLGLVELIMSLEEAFDVKFVESAKMKNEPVGRRGL